VLAVGQAVLLLVQVTGVALTLLHLVPLRPETKAVFTAQQQHMPLAVAAAPARPATVAAAKILLRLVRGLLQQTLPGGWCV
jgi:hypothetical protein